MAGKKGQPGKIKPTVLKVIAGTMRGKPKPEAQPARVLPDAPSFLSEYARLKWDALSERLYRLGLLTEIDGDAWAAYCEVYATWRDATEVLAEFRAADPRFRGLVIRTTPKEQGKGGGNTIMNPLLGIRNSALRDMVRIAAEFGLTPSARARINIEATGAPALDPAEAFFSGPKLVKE